MELKNKRVLVYGSGISGISAGVILASAEALPLIYDENEKLDIKKIREKIIAAGGDEDKIEILTGELLHELISEVELVVLSPGIPLDIANVQAFKAAGFKIIG